MAGKRGRPRAVPVSTERISDDDAFWRLKAIGLNSYQCMRTLEFCVAWQRAEGSIDRLLSRGDRSRATIFNRLKECRRAGFEPEFVVMTAGDAEKWEYLEYTRVEEIKRAQQEHRSLPFLMRLLTSAELKPEPDDSIDLDEPPDPKGWFQGEG